MPNYSPIIATMFKAARKAARGLLRDFSEIEQLQVSYKGPGDFVNTACVRAEKAIVAELKAARPSYGMLLPSGGVKGTDPVYRWIIDPLNGGSNFLHGVPFFCISISLEKTVEGKSEIIAAVVEAPMLRESFWVEKGAGVWYEKLAEVATQQMRLRVAGRKHVDESLMLIGSAEASSVGVNASAGASFRQLVDGLTPKTGGVRTLGSSALSLAYIAAGKGDVFIQQGAKPWDIASGVLLVSEAGGIVSDFSKGKEVLLSGEIIATNQQLYKPMMALLAE